MSAAESNGPPTGNGLQTSASTVVMSSRCKAVADVAAVLAPTGVLFGATILGTSGRHNRMARSLRRRRY